ncbi:putative ROK1-ATP-dependent RNA helicase [Testicularia cyperi]|uniref:RNA helicase n=1 Tax=Testicularia cyperi TaxID=1882483 RepID=A0A317XEY6_9BASI|nr:putative ROK1-ATP-dependent RNA helicase [Testicularia cyperi]
MDIFRTLAGGGASFDKKRFQDDLRVFGGAAVSSSGNANTNTNDLASSSSLPRGRAGGASGSASKSRKSSLAKTSKKADVPASSSNSKVVVPDTLDFFGTAAKSNLTTSAVLKHELRRKRAEDMAARENKDHESDTDSDDSDDDDDDEDDDEDDDDDADSTGNSEQKGKKRKLDDVHVDVDADGVGDAAPVTKQTLKAFLRANKIKLTGTDVPMPMASWSELEHRFSVGPWLRNNLDKWGWGTPTAIQKGAMPVLLANRDLLAGAPTGSGKTLSFLLPLLHHLRAPNKKEGFRAVIVSPTRELAQQIYDQLRRLTEGRNFRICVLTKSNDAAMNQDPTKRAKFDILITTPLRLVHAIEQEEVDLSNVRHLVLDEADRLLEEGFLEQTDSILAACSHPLLRKALFSATLPAGVEEMAKTFMVDECRVIVGTKDSATETIQQELQFVGSEDGKLHAMRTLIQQGGLKPPVLMFVQSIQRAKELFHELVYDGLHVDVIHSERPKAQRESVISAFKRGDVWVLICTELMARGIDFKGVQLVINYDFPQTVQSYIHRIGRTGRAGRLGRAITYFTKDDAAHLKTVVNVMRQSGCDVPEWMVKLKNPTKRDRKSLKSHAPDRKSIQSAAASSSIGRRQAIKKKDMVAASKRRKLQESRSEQAMSKPKPKPKPNQKQNTSTSDSYSP